MTAIDVAALMLMIGGGAVSWWALHWCLQRGADNMWRKWPDEWLPESRRHRRKRLGLRWWQKETK